MLKKYIKENYIKPKKKKSVFARLFKLGKKNKFKNKMSCSDFECFCTNKMSKVDFDFEKSLQETFVQNLFNIIDQKKLKDTDVYKKANIDRKLFSKIRSNINYKPSKNTVLALAIALELNLDETKMLLEKAGYALSKSILIDVIVEFFIINKQYDIFKINQVIYEYKLQPLGSNWN